MSNSAPKLGEIVHFYDSFGPYDRRDQSPPQVSPKPALVTFVYDDDTVDLTVFYASRNNPRQVVSVTRATGEEKNLRWDLVPNTKDEPRDPVFSAE